MRPAAPVARVSALLQQSGYTELPSPIAIAGVPFEFDAVLVGSERAYDLVVVVDTALDSDRRLRQRVEGLARALDVAGSERPVTVVTVGPAPNPEALETIARVARVLVVREDGQEDTLRNALSVLLPLELPTTSAESSEPLGAVTTWLQAQGERAGLASLVRAAADGEAAVSAALAQYLAEPLEPLAREE